MSSVPLAWQDALASATPLRPSRPNAPDVLRCQWADHSALIKSYHHCTTLYRSTVGRLALDREWWALQRMQSAKGRAPRPLARPRPWVVVMEWVDGVPLEQLPPDQVPPGRLLDEAVALLGDLEQAGVVHGDLGHDHWSAMGRESNLLWTADGRLVAIDFAGCWSTRGGLGRVGQAMRLHDQLLLTKLLYHFGDDSLADHWAWRLPSQRSLAWWELMRTLGKI
jgi:hypothetical protein